MLSAPKVGQRCMAERQWLCVGCVQPLGPAVVPEQPRSAIEFTSACRLGLRQEKQEQEGEEQWRHLRLESTFNELLVRK